jgi:anti-anti-sigma factor
VGDERTGVTGPQPDHLVRHRDEARSSSNADDDISCEHKATVTFAGELDTASADQACQYVREAIDAHGGGVLLDMAGLSFCDARGLGALVRMSRHAGQAGSPLRMVAPPPRLMTIIRMTGLEDTLPVHHGDQAGHVQVA